MKKVNIPQELKELVVKEALALRKHATPEEKEKLQLKSFEPNHINHCIYGQMTGDCYSKRSKVLQKKCLPKEDDIRNYFTPIERYVLLEGAKIEDLMKLIKS